MNFSHFLILYFCLLVAIGSAAFAFFMAMKASDMVEELERLAAEIGNDPVE